MGDAERQGPALPSYGGVHGAVAPSTPGISTSLAHATPASASERSSRPESPEPTERTRLITRDPAMGGLNELETVSGPEEHYRRAREQAQELGIKASGLPVRWTDLSVAVEGTGSELAPSLLTTVADALGPALVRRVLSFIRPNRSGRVILHPQSGVVDQGQMLLVLGRPGSGVTTFLRSITGDQEGYASVRGTVDYGHLRASKLAECGLGSEVVFVTERDVHFPTLSVGGTLGFALEAKTPARRPEKQSRSTWAARELRTLASFLGLSHALRTNVGSEAVPGISGGERKRLSIAEALATRASGIVLDNASAGLDSSTTLDVVTLLRTYAREGKRTVVAGLRQVAESVFERFDKVLVLHHGRAIFFGPVDQARAHFVNLGFEPLPGQTTADFVCACTDATTRRIRAGAERTVPKGSRELERAFLGSAAHKRLLVELATYDARNPRAVLGPQLKRAAQNERDGLTWRSSNYVISWPRQVGLLISRQIALVRADLGPMATRTAVNVALSLIVGTLFIQLPRTTAGANTRGAVLLLSVLFNVYAQLSELGNALAGRPIVRRQKHFGLTTPSALALARTLVDLPIIAAQVLIFGSTTYFLAGLQASRFPFFLLSVISAAFGMTTVFRAFAAISPTFDDAMRYCGLALNILVTYAGFLVPRPSMVSGLRWIFTINPVGRAYEAVLANEFHGLVLRCAAADVVPRGPTYGDRRYQTCAFDGSRPGTLEILGDDFLADQYAFSYERRWRNLGIILAVAVVMLICSLVATDLLHFAPSGQKRVFARMKGAKRELRRQKRIAKGVATVDDPEQGGGADPADEGAVEQTLQKPARTAASASLTWSHVHVSVDSSTECTELLHDISGAIKAGSLLALVGASGAGKTTLLSALSNRAPPNMTIRGDILIGGRPPEDATYRKTGFVAQLDLTDEQQTVREALEFSALLRQDRDVPRADKLAVVDDILEMLALDHLQDAIVGVPCAGLGLEERKRLSIGVELAAKPHCLFLDEPTSGLDSQSAHQIVMLMQRLARSGLAVCATIHQPSAEIFSLFDDLLVLQRGGRQAYFGPRAEAVGFFETPDQRCPDDVNHAEWLLEAVGGGIGDKEGAVDRSVQWHESANARALEDDIVATARQARDAPSEAPPRSCHILAQIVLVSQRTARHFRRDVAFAYSRVYTTVLVSLLIGVTFFQADASVVSLRNKTFSVFLILFVPPVFLWSTILKTFALRDLWRSREWPSRMYSQAALCCALLFADLPFALGCGSVYMLLWYTLVGLPANAGVIFYTWAMVLLFFLFQSTLALAVTALSSSVGVVSCLVPFFLVALECFNGALMPYSSMPRYWRWLYWISPMQHYVRGVLGVLLHDQPVVCAPSELTSFRAPPGTTCAQYTADFLRSSGAGYLTPESASSTLCKFCKFATGDDFSATLNIRYEDRWRSLFVFALYVVANVGVFFALSLVTLPRAAWLSRVRALAFRRKGASVQ